MAHAGQEKRRRQDHNQYNVGVLERDGQARKQHAVYEGMLKPPVGWGEKVESEKANPC